MSSAPLELGFVYLTQCCTDYIVTSHHHCRSLAKNWIIALVLKFHFSYKMLPYVKNVFTLQDEIREAQFWVLPWRSSSFMCTAVILRMLVMLGMRSLPVICLSNLRDLQVFELWILHCRFFISQELSLFCHLSHRVLHFQF